MTKFMSLLRDCIHRFGRDETGTSSIEFVIVFPMFFGFFLMTYESGMISANHVMLERGVDLTVREIRIGNMSDPNRELLRKSICDIALIIPDCETQLEIELIRTDPLNWIAFDPQVKCVNRGDMDIDNSVADPTANNQLMLIRACVRINPLLPTTGLGKTIVENNQDGAADGSYALISTSAFVVEPYGPAT